MGPFYTGCAGLYFFTSLATAIVFTIILSFAAFYGFDYYLAHHRSEAFDDKLSDERMNQARNWLIEEFGGERQE